MRRSMKGLIAMIAVLPLTLTACDLNSVMSFIAFLCFETKCAPSPFYGT